MGLAIIFIVVMSVTSSSVLVHGYQSFDLRRYCDQTLLVDCPTLTAGSAGTLTFEPYRDGPWVLNCSVEVRTTASCGSYSSDTFRFYLNIRQSTFNNLARVRIFDMTGIPTLEKSWQGEYLPQLSSPVSSAGQMLSSGVTRRPHIRIHYDSTRGTASSLHKGVIEYVIIESRSTSYNSWCSALGGYVNDDHICDFSNGRVNCPSNYVRSVTEMHPALDRQSCVLGGGEIAGVVIGSVAFVILVVAIIMVVCRRQAHVRAANTTVAFTNNPHSSAATVTIMGMPPQAAQQQYAPPQQHGLVPPPQYPTHTVAAPMPAPKY